MTSPQYTPNPEIVPDELLVGGPFHTDSVTLTDNQGAGALTRGSVLGFDAGLYGLVNATGTRDAATARAILLNDADPSGGNVEVLVLIGGDVNEDLLITGAGVTIADVKEPLRALNLRLKNPVSA